MDDGTCKMDDCNCVNCRLARIEGMLAEMEASLDAMIDDCRRRGKTGRR